MVPDRSNWSLQSLAYDECLCVRVFDVEVRMTASDASVVVTRALRHSDPYVYGGSSMIRGQPPRPVMLPTGSGPSTQQRSADAVASGLAAHRGTANYHNRPPQSTQTFGSYDTCVSSVYSDIIAELRHFYVQN